MKKIEIPKKSGGTRTIYVQGPHEKHNYRLLGYKLSEFHQKSEVANVSHGFIEGRSPISNAQQHINKKFTLTIDLKNFFDTITQNHLIRAGVNIEDAKKACYDGATRQGLSSSPAAANCAAIPLDKLIIQEINPDIVYTRYADDMSFSSDNLQNLLKIRDKIPELVKQCGFEINPKKTRIQSSNYGRRIITGVAVDDKIYATKKQRHILRAMKHNLTKLNKLLQFLLWTKNFLAFAVVLEINWKNISKYKGMSEWGKLKAPTKSYSGKYISTFTAEQTKSAFGPPENI